MRSHVQKNLLIDPAGDVFNAEGHWRARQLTRTMTLPSYVDYACRNLGYIAIEQTAQAVCISLRPSMITATSEISMLYQLAELERSHRYVLRQFESGWRHVILPDFNALLSVLHGLRATAAQPDNAIRGMASPADEAVPGNVKQNIGA